MVPDVHQPHTFAEFLEVHLNLTPELTAAGLSVEQVANVALLAVAHSDAYAATAHLVSLMGGLPVPSEDPKDFWFRLWQASGSAIFMPPNITSQVLRALNGDGTGLAYQLLSALEEMDQEQRAAAGLVIGQALEANGVSGYRQVKLGEWWLRDAEATSWRVVYAAQKTSSVDGQIDFQQGWRQR
ncbi:hypothetical protein [Streptomyces roseus]|uniref:hypothetical protein n=1 Tax=Streptomyces roseus TaxID=66430 RepID=UPI001FD7303E|nr:hypothetical protein [Streptomyces roseus]